MNVIGEAPDWGAGLFAVLLIAAALDDGLRRKISNLIILALFAGTILVAAVMGIEASFWTNGAVFVALLLLGSLAFSAGMLGGGDVKLLATTAFWFAPADLLILLPAVAIAGGLLVLAWVPLRMIRGKTAARTALKERSLPYGIAIALGGIVSATIVRGIMPWTG